MLQREDGTWGQYPNSAPDISACVKSYLALKLLGDHRDMPHMIKARKRILELGGAEKINTFSMFYLACLGQVSWDACPTIPPEVVLLPRCSPFHLDKVSAWTRTMILPLAICTALRPVRTLPSPSASSPPSCLAPISPSATRRARILWPGVASPAMTSIRVAREGR